MASLVFSHQITFQSDRLDCIAGILVGALLWWVKIMYGGYLDSFMTGGSLWAPLAITVVTTFLIRIHPEPADACCKCFEDGVAFAGVFIGVKFGQWRNPALNTQARISSHVTPAAIILLKSTTMILIGILISRNRVNRFSGVSILFAWRATTKPLLHRVLPPFYRLLEKLRLDMPRRYFMRASYCFPRDKQ
jgi:dihydrosphingosine 1-phosphate phosphatase